MTLFESDIETINKATNAKASKRFISFSIDFIIVLFISYGIFLGLFSSVKNINQYKNLGSIIDDEISYYNDFVEESHIVEFIDKTNNVRKDDDIMVLENISRAIYHSYLVFGNAQQPNFVIDDNHAVTKNGEASLLNDTISYYYTQFIPNRLDLDILDYKGKTEIEYLFDVYKNAFRVNSSIFVFDENQSSVPVLKTDGAYYLFHYMFIDSDDDIGEKGAAYYRVYYSAYTYMLEEAEKLLLKSEPYYSNHYLNYESNYFMQGRYVLITLACSVFLGYFVAVLIPKLIFKDERTIGRVLFNIRVANSDGSKINVYKVIIKSLINCFGYFGVLLIMFVMPPFNGIYDILFIPLTIVSSISFMALIGIITLITIILNVPIFLTHQRYSLIDIIFKNKVVDLNYLDEGDNDNQYENSAY